MPEARRALYLSEEWLALRETILARDGYCCRNCGSGEALQVHHWLPQASHREATDDHGYSRAGHRLLVHESGLVTLCEDCHAALTAIRKRNLVLKNPALKKLASPEKHGDNIFELWALNEKQVPFCASKDTWGAASHYRVEQIEITKWPYGRAWGRFIRSNEEGELEKIPNAGTYRWSIWTATAKQKT